MLYTAICYLPYTLFLFLTVFIFPALAFSPSLLRTPVLFTAIPVVSTFIVNCTALVLFKFNLYHHVEICAITVLLSILAVIRSYHFYRSGQIRWDKSAKYFLLINFGLLLPLLAFSGLSAFMSNDALMSWNDWALHYYVGETPDTMGYPPFLPILISYCYQLLGTTEFQGAVKAVLFVFPFLIMNAIAFAHPRNKEFLFVYLLLILVAVFSIDYRFYSIGYADPMLAANASIALLLCLKYFENDNEKQYLWLTIICSMTTALSKQPGLIWACVSLPLLFILKAIRQKKFNRAECIAIILLFIPPSIWLLGPGSHFYQNTGVISASLHQEHVTVFKMLETFFSSIKTYFLLKPAILLLFLLTALACQKKWYNRFLFFIFFLPGICLWFVFGSYDLRLGLYLLGTAGVLLASEHLLFDKSVIKLPLKQTAVVLTLLGLTGFGIFSYTDQENSHINVPHRIYPLNAGLSNIYHYFGDHAEFVYKNIYQNPHVKIWAPNRMIAGIFYSHVEIVPEPKTYSAEDIYQNLMKYKPDYVFAGFCDRDYDDCNGIKKLIRKYPGLLIEIPIKHEEYDHRLFKMNM